MLLGKNEWGFTLIELLVAIAIISALAAVAIPNFMDARDRARFSTAVSAVDALRTALEMYTVDWNSYPENGVPDIIARLSGNPAYYTGANPVNVTTGPIVYTAIAGQNGTWRSYSMTTTALDRHKVGIQATPVNIANESVAGSGIYDITPPKYPY